MRISIPSSYVESVVPKGARTVKDLSFGDWFDVEVKELSSLDAPIAIEWRIDRHDQTRYKAIDGIVRLRHFEGHFYQAQAITEAYKDNIHLSSSEMLEMISTGSHSSNPLLKSDDDGVDIANKSDRYTSFKPEEYRAVYSTGKDDKQTELDNRASNIIIVDGMVWVRTHEPALKVERTTSFHSAHDFDIRIISTKNIDKNDVQNVFRLDRMDDAIAFGKKLCGGDNFIIRQDPQILRSDVLSYCDDRPALVACLEYFINNSKDHVLDESKNYVIAWYDLRESFNDITEDTSEETLDLVVEQALKVLSETKSPGVIEDWLGATAERWRGRPISLTHDVNFNAL